MLKTRPLIDPVEEGLHECLKKVLDPGNAIEESCLVVITHGIISFVNDKICNISAFGKDELVGRHYRLFNANFQAEDFHHNMSATIASGEIWQGEINIRSRDGRYYWLDTTIVPSLDKDGFPYRYVATGIKITDTERANELTIANRKLNLQKEEKEKHAEELNIAHNELKKAGEEIRRLTEESEQKVLKRTAQLALSEKRLARAQEVAHLGSWELDFSVNMLLLSDETCRIYGLSPGENRLTFEQWVTFIHPGDLSMVLKEVAESQDSRKDFSFYHHIIQRNGGIRYIYSESKHEVDSDGVSPVLYGITHDVTKIKLAEEQMEFDLSNLTSLINNNDDAMWSVDRDFKFITCNDAFKALIKKMGGKVVMRGGNALMPEFSHEKLKIYKAYYDRAFAGESFTVISSTAVPFEFWEKFLFILSARVMK